MLLETCRGWLQLHTLAGLWKTLKRLRIRLKRGQQHVHSPDPLYAQKWERIQACYREVAQGVAGDPESATNCLLFLDEVSYARQPDVAAAYHPVPEGQPFAHLSHRSNDVFRVVGTVDACSGRVCFLLRKKITVATLRNFYVALVAAYPQAERIYLVVDNWPVHYHADLLAALGPQPYASEFVRPREWSDTPRARAPRLNLPIVLIPLPTYASWLNPIEKLWGKSRREITHMHQQATDLDALKRRLTDFFTGFADGSASLLQTIGIPTTFNC